MFTFLKPGAPQLIDVNINTLARIRWECMNFQFATNKYFDTPPTNPLFKGERSCIKSHTIINIIPVRYRRYFLHPVITRRRRGKDLPIQLNAPDIQRNQIAASG